MKGCFPCFLKEDPLELYKTVDNDSFLRIDNFKEAAITIYKFHNSGHILSLTVPEEDREGGIGRALLESAEQELMDCGIRWMEADFSDSLDMFPLFLKHMGYKVRPGVPMYSVSIEELLSGKETEKAMAAKTPGMDFVPLSELSFDQWKELIYKLRRYQVNIGNQDIARMEQDLSGAVYDKDNRPMAVIFCSEAGNILNVEFLFGFGDQTQRYILAAIQGMLKVLCEQGEQIPYERLCVVAVGPNTKTLLEKGLGQDGKLDTIGNTIYARKRIHASESAEPTANPRPDETLEEEWRREIRKIPLQSNISYKLPWGRGRDHMGNAAKDPKDPASCIQYNKHETEKEGLRDNNCIRITTENRERFSGYLPEDMARELLRPFFRGLALLKDAESEPEAVILWKYGDMARNVGTEAEILYFRASSKNAGEALLEEYTHEISEEDAFISRFLFPSLTKEEQEILLSSGFVTEERENTDILIPAGDLGALPHFKKKPRPNIKRLSEISENQFKRGIAKLMMNTEEKLPDDLAFLTMRWYDRMLSCCVVMDDEVQGMLLVHRLPSGIVCLDLLQSCGNAPGREMMNLLRYFSAMLRRKTEENTLVLIKRNEQQFRGLMDVLFPGKTGEPAVFGERKEK